MPVFGRLDHHPEEQRLTSGGSCLHLDPGSIRAASVSVGEAWRLGDTVHPRPVPPQCRSLGRTHSATSVAPFCRWKTHLEALSDLPRTCSQSGRGRSSVTRGQALTCAPRGDSVGPLDLYWAAAPHCCWPLARPWPEGAGSGWPRLADQVGVKRRASGALRPQLPRPPGSAEGTSPASVRRASARTRGRNFLLPLQCPCLLSSSHWTFEDSHGKGRGLWDITKRGRQPHQVCNPGQRPPSLWASVSPPVPEL